MSLSPTDEKKEVFQVEGVEPAPAPGSILGEANPDGVRKSAFDQLPILETVKIFKRAVFYCFICYTMSMLDSWSNNVGNAIIVNKGFVQVMTGASDGAASNLNSNWLSAWGCMYNCGQFLCLPTIPYIADRFGRVFCFWLSWIAFILGMVFLTIARTPALWTVGMFFTGLSGAIEQLTVTPYAVEIAPTRIRGGLVTFQAVWSSIFGIVLSVMLQVMNAKYPYNWIKPFYVVWPLAAIMFVSIAILPESPWYHARRGNKEKACKSLKRLYGDVPGFDIEEEYGVILRTLAHERRILELQGHGDGWLDLFRHGNLKRTLIVMGFEAGILLGGLSLVGNFRTLFFSLAGQSDPFLGNMIVSIVNLVVVCGYSLISDRLGRRWPVIICFIVVCVCLWLMGILAYVDSSKAVGAVLVTSACLWSGAETITQNVYWLMAAELPQAQLRLKTCSAGLFWGAALGLSTIFAVPPSLLALGLKSAFIWAALTVPVIVYLIIWLPETKGRSSSEIDELFERKVPAWKWKNTVTHVEEQLNMSLGRGEVKAAQAAQTA